MNLKGEVGVGVEGEGEEANFACTMEVLHGLMAPEVSPKGVEVEGIGMDENAVEVVVGLGSHKGTLKAE